MLDYAVIFVCWARHAFLVLNFESLRFGSNDVEFHSSCSPFYACCVLQLLEADLSEGQSLLDSSLELAKAALQVAEDEDDREVIEEQVAKLQAQMDAYK